MTNQSTEEPIGLLAGWGRFPIAFAEKARSVGRRVICVGIKHEAPAELQDLVHCFYWTGFARLGRMIRCFKREGVRRVVMAGKVHKHTYLHRPWRLFSLMPDWRTIRWFLDRRRRDNRDDTMLMSIIAEFEKDGIHFESALDLCPELLVRAGILTRRKPSKTEEADIDFGCEMAKRMGDLDIGQSVMVKEKTVLAVEAIEGTDQAIARAGTLCRSGGFVVIKVAKPRQDMRFDVPTVGKLTVEGMFKAGARVLAVEADKTIFLDREETIALADRHGITIVAVTP
jgi:UDP-2,3-diacylglucosamine hydrolase